MAERSEYLAEWYQSRKDIYRERHLQKTYGLSLATLFQIMKDQNECCAICGRDFNELKPKNIHLDHCHTTNQIRGVLCNNCNMALGLLKDDTQILLSAIKYLETSRG